jgi:hypothetical protein
MKRSATQWLDYLCVEDGRKSKHLSLSSSETNPPFVLHNPFDFRARNSEILDFLCVEDGRKGVIYKLHHHFDDGSFL